MTAAGRYFVARAAACRGALRRRWRGEVALGHLLFVDMLAWGTILNLTTTGVSLALLALGAPTWVVVVTWMACWPWNVFLCLSIWRTSDRSPGLLSTLARPVAAVWTVGISVI